MKNENIVINNLSIVFIFQPGRTQDVESLLNQISLDSLIENVKALSGEKEIIVDGKPVIIDSRRFDSKKKPLAAFWLNSKLKEYGYITDFLLYSANEEIVFSN